MAESGVDGGGLVGPVFVIMREAIRETIDAFERAVATMPEVQQAQRLFVDPDYLLRVVARDLPAFYDRELSALPGVQRLGSTPVMNSVIEDRPLPL